MDNLNEKVDLDKRVDLSFPRTLFRDEISYKGGWIAEVEEFFFDHGIKALDDKRTDVMLVFPDDETMLLFKLRFCEG